MKTLETVKSPRQGSGICMLILNMHMQEKNTSQLFLLGGFTLEFKRSKEADGLPKGACTTE